MFLIKIVQIFFSGILNVIYEALFAAAFIMIIMKNAVQYIENRIYGEELKESLGMNFSVPFSLKGSLKCTNHVNVHKLYTVVYINTVWSLYYPFQFRIF